MNCPVAKCIFYDGRLSNAWKYWRNGRGEISNKTRVSYAAQWLDSARRCNLTVYSHRSLENQPLRVDSKPATLR